MSEADFESVRIMIYSNENVKGNWTLKQAFFK